MLCCWAHRGSHPRKTAACCTTTDADSIQNLFLAQWLSSWHSFVPALVLFATALCGDGTKLGESSNKHEMEITGSQDNQDIEQDGRTRWLEANAKGNQDLFPALKQNQRIKFYFKKVKSLKCVSCVQNILYTKTIFFSSSSFLWKQFCHCPGCSGRQKTWSVLKKSSSYWLLREPQNMMWPLSYFWLMPQITCPVGLTWICLTKVSDYFKY